MGRSWDRDLLLNGMNNEIFYVIYNLSQIPIWAKLSIFLSYPLTYILIILVLIGAIFFSKRKMFNFSLIFLTAIFSWVIANILKNIIRINRPFVDLDIVPLSRDIGFSFPSEHMTVFVAISVALFFINKKIGIIFFIIAILIGLSRIVIGVHYPSDIAGGLIVGFLVGFGFIKIFKKI